MAPLLVKVLPVVDSLLRRVRICGALAAHSPHSPNRRAGTTEQQDWRARVAQLLTDELGLPPRMVRPLILLATRRLQVGSEPWQRVVGPPCSRLSAGLAGWQSGRHSRRRRRPSGLCRGARGDDGTRAQF
jgi:hypothetical protein